MSDTNINILWMPARRILPNGQRETLNGYNKGLIKAKDAAKKIATSLKQNTQPDHTQKTKLWIEPEDLSSETHKAKYNKLKKDQTKDYKGEKIAGLTKVSLKPSLWSRMRGKDAYSIELHPHQNLYRLNKHAEKEGYIKPEKARIIDDLCKKTDKNSPEYVDNAYLASDIKRLLVLYLGQTVLGGPPPERKSEKSKDKSSGNTHYEHYLDIDMAERLQEFNAQTIADNIDTKETYRMITTDIHNANDTIFTSNRYKDDQSHIDFMGEAHLPTGKDVTSQIFQTLKRYHNTLSKPRQKTSSNNVDERLKQSEDRTQAVDYDMDHRIFNTTKIVDELRDLFFKKK